MAEVPFDDGMAPSGDRFIFLKEMAFSVFQMRFLFFLLHPGLHTQWSLPAQTLSGVTTEFALSVRAP